MIRYGKAKFPCAKGKPPTQLKEISVTKTTKPKLCGHIRTLQKLFLQIVSFREKTVAEVSEETKLREL